MCQTNFAQENNAGMKVLCAVEDDFSKIRMKNVRALADYIKDYEDIKITPMRY